MSKQDMRKELASLSFTEKIGILERLRDRSWAFSLVKLSLLGGVRDLNRDQEEAWQKLEAEAQKYLNSYLKSAMPGASLAILRAVLRHWIEFLRGRVRFEVDVEGKVGAREIARIEELDSLLGPSQTPATLLRTLGGESNGS
jgi:hypothetical protein